MHQAGAVAFGEDQLDGDVGEGPGGGAGVLGEEDDRNLGHDLFQLARGLQAVEDRHGNVEDDQVGLALNGEVDGFLAVAGFGAEFVILLVLKHFAEHFADEGIVVSDENRSGHGIRGAIGECIKRNIHANSFTGADDTGIAVGAKIRRNLRKRISARIEIERGTKRDGVETARVSTDSPWAAGFREWRGLFGGG